ncbi:PrsW family intramembrane metalloprotease [Mariniluteicoccus flavus]
MSVPQHNLQPAAPYAPHHPAAFPPGWPNLRRKPQAMVVPILVIALGAIVALGLILVFGAISLSKNGGGSWIVAIVFSAVIATIGIIYLNWLDRWEPEPPHLLWAAFLWGGGVSILLALMFGAPFGGLPAGLQAAIVAPLTEESAKGLFLVVVMLASRRARSEFNTLTDAIVYAGFIGIGFSVVEDIMYIAGNATVGEAGVVAVVRGLGGAFGHSVYTAMTAIGLWKGLMSSGPMRFVWPVLGWSVAVVLHGLHNGSTLFGIGAVIAALLIFDLGGFIAFLIIGIRSHRNEGRVIAAQLHPMVANGWVTPAEATWLSTKQGRRAHLKSVPPADRKRLLGFRDDATELAFVRDRLDAQVARNVQPSPELLAHHDELVGLLKGSQQWVGGHLPAANPAALGGWNSPGWGGPELR